METSTPAASLLGGVRKRKLELDPIKRALELGELDSTFVAGKDGAYDPVDMPKRFKFPGAIDGEDVRTTALYVRVMILSAAERRELRARATTGR